MAKKLSKKVTKELEARAFEASRMFIQQTKGFTILDTKFCDGADFVAKEYDPFEDKDVFHFIQVTVTFSDGEGFKPIHVDTAKRIQLESAAMQWLANYDGDDAMITFDQCDLAILNNNKAIVRYANNILFAGRD